MPVIAAVVRARADGEAAGDLSSESTRGYRRSRSQEWAIPAAATRDGVLELELAVTHTWTQSAWWGTVPRLLPIEARDGNARAVEVFNLFVIFGALVALGQIGVTSIMVYVVDRRRRQYLWFGLQALLACYLPLYYIGWTQWLFGVYDTSLLAISLVGATTVSVQFTHIFFGLKPPWRGLWPTGIAVCAVAAIVHGPFTATGIAGVPTVLFLTVLLNYQVITCARLVRRGIEGASARYSLASWLSLLVTGAPDLVYWLGLGDPLGGVRLASVGFAASGLLLSLRLSQEHITSLGRSDDLNVQLATRVDQLETRRAEIEQLNVELRRQIEDRAGQIYAALALAGRAGVRAPVLVAGEVVQGRYRVLRPLGEGGMGTVYEVTRIADGRRLALKLAREVDGESLARLAREAQTASTVSHPNVVGIVDVDVAPSGFLYLVMELVEGTSLYEHRPRFGDPVWAVPVLRQIADGLAALHRAGVVHRDLKPGNVLVTPAVAAEGGVHGRGPQVKISDFGIALNNTERFSKLLAGELPEDSARPWPGLAAPSVHGSYDGQREISSGVLAARPLQPVDLPRVVPREPTTDVQGIRAREAGTDRAREVGADPAREAGTEPARDTVRANPALGASRRAQVSPAVGVPQGLGDSSFLTRSGNLPGTPSYIAPELAQGRALLSPAADVFAFGVIAYELITAQRPFAEAPVLALVDRRPVPTPPPIAEAWPDAPAALAVALDACLSLDPAQRPTAQELAQIFGRLLVPQPTPEPVPAGPRPVSR